MCIDEFPIVFATGGCFFVIIFFLASQNVRTHHEWKIVKNYIQRHDISHKPTHIVNKRNQVCWNFLCWSHVAIFNTVIIYIEKQMTQTNQSKTICQEQEECFVCFFYEKTNCLSSILDYKNPLRKVHIRVHMKPSRSCIILLQCKTGQFLINNSITLHLFPE